MFLGTFLRVSTLTPRNRPTRFGNQRHELSPTLATHDRAKCETTRFQRTRTESTFLDFVDALPTRRGDESATRKSAARSLSARASVRGFINNAAPRQSARRDGRSWTERLPRGALRSCQLAQTGPNNREKEYLLLRDT